MRGGAGSAAAREPARWLRTVGDALFLAGVLAFAGFVARLWLGPAKVQQEALPPDAEAAPEAA